MIRGVTLFGVGGILTYATVGQASLHGLQALAGWSAHDADRAALAAFLLAWPIATLGLALTTHRRGAMGDVFGSAHFLSARAVRALTRNRGLIVGREARPRGRLIRYDGEAHLLTLAPTRSGKGVGAVIPNLLDAERSVLCIDPKGENARVTARQRRRFGRVLVLDPFGVSGIPTCAYNPLDRIDAASPDAAEEAATLAEALVSDPPGQVAEAHWNEEAKALLAGLILFVAAEEPPHRRTLAQVRDHLTGAPDAVRALLARMQASPAANGLVARAANRQLGKAEREAAGVLSSAQRHTHFLDSPRIAAVTARSDLDLADLKRATTSLFLVLPPDRLDAYSRWLRLVVAQALTALARVPDKPAAPVLFLLDEFAALGRLEAVERAMGLMAGYGLQLWPILQDLHGLKSLYGARWPSFLANAGVIQVFNVNDGDTAAWVSRTLGEATEAYETTSTGRSGKLGDWAGTSRTHGRAEHLTRRALLTPDEVMRLPGARMLLLTAGAAPILAAKPRYYADPEFRGRFAQTEVT